MCDLHYHHYHLHQATAWFLIRPLDSQGAAEAVCRLLSSPKERERMGKNGRELVRELFPWKRMSDTLLEDYARLLAAKGADSSSR